MPQNAAIIVGGLLFALGALGYVPVAAPDGRLLDIVQVDAADNLLHLITAAAAIWAGFRNERAAREFFRWAGVLYALIAAGPVGEGEAVLAAFAHDATLDLLRGLFALLALTIGWSGLRPETGKKYQATL